MNTNLFRGLAPAMLLATVLTTSAALPDIIGVGFSETDSPVYRIHAANGEGVQIGHSGFPRLNALAINSAGTLYAAGNGNTLITINPVTGAGTLATTLPFSDVRALAFSPGNVLFAIRNPATATADTLYTIDPHTGAATFIGSTGVNGLQALAIAPNGTLFGWEVGGETVGGLGLVTINPLTGLATDVNPAVGGGSASVQGLGFAPDGTLYGGRSSLFKINLETGVLIPVGGSGFTDMRGLEFLPVPEPSACALLALGAGLFLVRRANRH